MASKSVTSINMRPAPPPSEPQAGGGALGEQAPALVDPVADTDAAKAERIIAAFYEGGREAVQLWGGVEALARLWGADLGDLSRRLGRKPHKGTTCYAFGDFWALACTEEAAARAFLSKLSDALGYEPPKKKRRQKTPEETIAALKKQLKLFGPAGEQALERAGVEDDG